MYKIIPNELLTKLGIELVILHIRKQANLVIILASNSKCNCPRISWSPGVKKGPVASSTSQVSGFSAVLIRERYHQQGIVSTDNDDDDDRDGDNGYNNVDDDHNDDDDDDDDDDVTFLG